MKKNLVIGILMLHLLLNTTIGKAQTFNSNLANMLQDTLNSYVAQISNIKGMSASVYIPGQGYWKGVAGLSYSGHPITSDMEFGIASNTKLFVSTIILKLTENGILSLNDSIHKWLPNYPHINPNITIKQLLNHTSGVNDPIFVSPWMDTIIAHPTRVFTPTEVLSWVGNPSFAAGTGWEYSNVNYILAGMIAQSATGHHISNLIRDSILTPLQLDSTFYDVYEPVLGNIAHRWWNTIDYNDTSRIGLNTAGGCAGAIFSTTSEMAQWYKALFGGQILKPTSMSKLTQFVSTPSPTYFYGLGIARETTLGKTYWTHGGRTWGYNSKMIYDSCSHVIVCGLNNTDPSGMDGVTFLLYRVILNHVPGCIGNILGPTNVCRKEQSITYTIPTITNATSYVWTLPPGATGTSNTNSITVNFGSNSVSGDITVKGSSLYGSGATSSLHINVKIVPTSVTLNCNFLKADSTADTYKWINCNNGNQAIPGATNQIYSPLSNGNYAVIMKRGTCVDTSACISYAPSSLSINGVNPASVTTTSPTSFCIGDSVVLNATNAVGLSYQWQNNGNNISGATQAHYIANSSGSYSVMVSNGSGCSASAPATNVTANPKPNAIISATNTAICPNGNATLTASGGNTYVWSNGDTTATTLVNQVGNYTVIATNQFGCKDTSSILSIMQKTLPTTVKIKTIGLLSVCAPSMVSFVLDMPLGSTTGFAYQWYLQGAPIQGATDSVYNAIYTGSYTVIISGGSNCVKYATAQPATIKPTPIASFAANGSTTFCAGGFVTLLAPSIAGYTYTWLKDGISSGSGNSKIFKLAGNYTVIAKYNGCNDTANPTLPIVVNPLPVASLAALNATTFCVGDSCLLVASPIAALSYEWHNGNAVIDTTSANHYNIGTTATIKVIVKDTNSCISKLSTSSVKTKANPIPSASISSLGNTTISSIGSVKLKASPSSGVSWQWYKAGIVIIGATANTYTATSGGSYTVAITKLGCTGVSTPVIVIQTSPKEEGGTTTFTEGSFEMSAYPNPVSEVLTVSVSGIEDVNGTILVMDINGKMLVGLSMLKPKQNIVMNNFPSGIYFIRYKNNDGRTGTVKVVKE